METLQLVFSRHALKEESLKLLFLKRDTVALIVVEICLTAMLISSLFMFQIKEKEALVSVQRFSKGILPKNSVRDLSLLFGMRLAKEKHYKAARKLFKDVLVTEATNVTLLNNLAFVVGELGDISKAAEYLENAVKLSRDCAECFNNLGTLYYKQGKYEDAQEAFENAVKADPALVDATLNLAIVMEQQGNWETAMKWYKKSEPGIKKPELKKWVYLRGLWMAEISRNSSRKPAASTKD